MNEENSHYCVDTVFSENIKPKRDDMRYCKELSRKAVARAALHLGVEKMDRDALYLVADSLLYYLERIGNVLVEMVQKSRRTSAHCNVLDVILAVDACTAPVARQVTMRGGEKLNLVKTQAATTNVGGNMGEKCSDIDYRECGWEGLAHFLFGKNWLSIPLVSISEVSVNESRHTVNSKETNNIIRLPIETEVNSSTKHQGWNAPFVGTIPHFPISRSSCKIANPHKLPSSTTTSFHCWFTNEDVCGVDFYHHPSQCQKQYLEKNPLYEHNGNTFDEGYGEITYLEATNNFSKKILSSGDISTPLIMTEKTADSEKNHIPDDYILNGNVMFWGTVCSQGKNIKEHNSSVQEADISNEVLLQSQENAMKPSVGNKNDKISFDTKMSSYGVDIYKRYNDHSTNERIRKKVKVNNSKSMKRNYPNTTVSNLPEVNDTELVERTYRKSRYVPSFYPPFPSEYAPNYLEKLQSEISILDIVANSMCRSNQNNNYLKRLHSSTLVTTPDTNNDKNYQKIRSSLVSLEHSIGTSYSNTGYRSNYASFRIEKKSETLNFSSFLSSNSSPSVLLKKTHAQIRSEPNIVPLGKASGSRVSRILEGSIDL